MLEVVWSEEAEPKLDQKTSTQRMACCWVVRASTQRDSLAWSSLALARWRKCPCSGELWRVWAQAVWGHSEGGRNFIWDVRAQNRWGCCLHGGKVRSSKRNQILSMVRRGSPCMTGVIRAQGNPPPPMVGQPSTRFESLSGVRKASIPIEKWPSVDNQRLSRVRR